MTDESLIMMAAFGAALIFFALGLAMVLAGVFLFLKDRRRKMARAPAWALALGAGLFLTFVVPGLIIFLAAYLIYVQTPPPPPVTCYVPMPPEDALGSLAPAAGALITGRKALLERLHGEGRIPEDVYRKAQGRR